jgi:hypothetical protein
LVSGPSRAAAAALFAQQLLDYALALHGGSVHLVHCLEVAEVPAAGIGDQQSAAARGTGTATAVGGGMAVGSSGGDRRGGGSGPAGGGGSEEAGWRFFELGELLTPAGRLVREDASMPSASGGSRRFTAHC